MHLHGQDGSGRAAAPATVDDPGADGRAGHHHQAPAQRVRLRRRAARSRGGPFRECTGAGWQRCLHAWRSSACLATKFNAGSFQVLTPDQLY